MAGKNEFQEKYEILGEIGKGGMGVVYKARQISLDRPVAVKMLAKELADNELFIQRFTEEARAIARMRNHENIVEVYDFIETDENFYIVMEYVEGESLSRILKRRGRLPLAESADILARMARALHHAHLAGVIHRDIKPENILIDKRGRLKVMDFGVAHLSGANHKTQTGMVLGTPLYMSPEQARGTTVDARSDIYSMGVLLYQCVTGALPFTADSPIAIAMKHVTQAPIPPRAIDPAIPERLERGILKTLAKDPAQRFQTADEFAEFLEDPELRAVLSAPPHLDALLHSAATLIGTMPTVEGEPATAVEHLEVQRAALNETATLIEESVSAPGAPGGVPAGFLAAAGSAAAAGSVAATGSIAGSAGMERVPAVSLAAGSPEALSAAAVAAGLAPPLQPPANRLKPGDWVIAAVLLGLGVLIAYLLWPVLIR